MKFKGEAGEHLCANQPAPENPYSWVSARQERQTCNRFQMLSDDYEREQEELRGKRLQLSKEMIWPEEQAENVDRFIGKVRKYLDLDELTPAVLNDMAKAVYVHAPDKSSGHGEQQIDISYDLVGIPQCPCSMTYQTEKRHSRSYAVSRKQSYTVL